MALELDAPALPSRPDVVPVEMRQPVPQRVRIRPGAGAPHTRVDFVDGFELELARVLDQYGVRWRYEPNFFPLLWDGDKITEGFTPDFYLPDRQLYVELTTGKPELMGDKKRKVRLLRELYPSVRIKLLARSDYYQFLASLAEGSPEFRVPLPAEINRVLVSPYDLEGRICDLGHEISRDYLGRQLVMVGLLKGITFFFADLARQITVPYALDYLSLSKAGQGAGKRVKVVRDTDLDLRGRDVLVVDDIVSTGLSLEYVLKHLADKKPASLEACVLLDRPARRLVPNLEVRYTGFEVPNDYVVGYGLDHRENFRNLPGIYSLNQDVYKTPLPRERHRLDG